MLLRSFIFAGTVLGIFLITQLRSRKKVPGNALLILWISVISLHLLFYYDNLSPQPLAPQWLALMGFALPLLSSPLLYLYITSSALQARKLLPHLLPYLFYCILIGCFPTSVRDGFPHFNGLVPAWMVNLLMAMMAIIPAFYALLSLIVLWSVKRALAFSFVLLFVVLFLLIRYSVTYSLLSYQNLFAVVGAVLVLYVFFIGYLGLRPEARPRYQNSGLDIQAAEGLFGRLQLYMQEKQPFLDESLALVTLANQLSVTPNHLSQAINQQASANFLSYINTYRVEAVKQKLKDPAYAHYSILAIAYDCGFRSKSSFNKIFKETEGLTPSAYQRTGPPLPLRTTGAVN